MAQLESAEIRALSKIVDELDYYQILRVERSADSRAIKRAYYESSRSFHPDAVHTDDAALLADCERITKRVTEAYCVLRDRGRRKTYDSRIDSRDGVRIQLAEAKAEHRRAEVEERQGKTPQGRQFFQKAMRDMQRGNPKGAIQHLQMALTFEPDNRGFRERLEGLRAQA